MIENYLIMYVIAQLALAIAVMLTLYNVGALASPQGKTLILELVVSRASRIFQWSEGKKIAHCKYIYIERERERLH